MSTCKKTGVLIIVLILFLASSASADNGPKEVYTIRLADAHGSSKWLPYIGEHPVIIVYEDFRNAGSTKELYLKSLGKPEFINKIKLVYISNTAPAWYIPDLLINIYFKKRETQYKNINFLIDNDRSLQRKWRIADTDGRTVIILVSHDARIIDITYKVPSKNEFDKFIESAEKMLDF